ncbi:hypothetical protein quinque_004618 [Culex quinquefasciatus]
MLMSTLLDRFRTTPASRILPITELETTLQRVIQDCRQLLLYLNNALRLWDRQQQHRSIAGVNGDDGPVASRTRGALRRLSGTAPGPNRKPRVKRPVRGRPMLMSTLLDRFRTTPASRILPITELETTLQRVIQDCRQLLLYLNNALRLWDRQQQHRSIAGVNGDDGPVASRTRGALRRLSGTAPGPNRKPRVKRPVRGRR